MDPDPWAYPDSEHTRLRLSAEHIALVAEDGTTISIPLEHVRAVRVEYEATPKDAKKAAPKKGRADAYAHGQTLFTVLYRTTDKWTRRDRESMQLPGAHPALVEFAAEATRLAFECKQSTD